MNKPKKDREISYGFSLNDEQKAVKAGVFNYDVSFILGNFGSGKTACATQIALDLLYKDYVKNIIISRPVDFEATGFLKGSIQEKMAFHTFPLKQNLYACSGKDKIEKEFGEGRIQIFPIDYMKGITFVDSVVIIDEFEDISYDDFKLIITRLGKGSKLIFTGSAEQIGIKNSCIHRIKCLQNSGLVNFHILKAQHRNDSITPILDFIEEHG
jgi:phosphate starvation-inducible PhoH-like protein